MSFSFFAQNNFAQNTNVEISSGVDKPEKTTPLLAVEKSNDSTKDESSRGTKLYKYIMSQYRVPDVPGLKGKVVVDFVIDEYGNIGNFIIVKDLGYGSAEELIRVLKTTQGNWKPSFKNGKPVKVKYTTPLNIVVPEK